MSDKRLRRRTPVRFKQIRDIAAELSARIAIDIDIKSAFLEKANFDNRDLILVDKSALAMQVETDDGKKWFPTLRGILAWQPDGRWAAVDHGAIPFLMNGADCMAAGIHRACDCIEEGALIWIRDQAHGKPLAIGWATMDSTKMGDAGKGKAVKMRHHIGDELWELEL